jgi:DNA-binding sugar fermentation-stimulating protein
MKMKAPTPSTAGPVLFELSTLFKHVIVSRPSKQVKTPYVADMLPFSDDVARMVAMHTNALTGSKTGSSSSSGSGSDIVSPSKKDRVAAYAALSAALRGSADAAPETLVLGHTPSLDCAGMVVPGSVVYCTQNAASGTTKTAFAAQLCEEIREGDSRVTVGCHPFLAERAAKRFIELALLPELGAYDVGAVASQVSYGRSRVDYVLPSADGATTTLLEIKNCVGADYVEHLVPAARSDVGVYTRPAAGYVRHAIFPHGAKKPGIGVVSDRAIKHVHELTALHGTVDEASKRTIQSAILFVVNRADCEAMRPCHEACMLFAQVRALLPSPPPQRRFFSSNPSFPRCVRCCTARSKPGSPFWPRSSCGTVTCARRAGPCPWSSTRRWTARTSTKATCRRC